MRAWSIPSGIIGEAMLGHVVHPRPSKRRHWRKVAVAQRHACSTMDLEHRSDVGRRADDHAQDVARGRLLLERLGELAVLRPAAR
jgi:hypothetical protein